MRFKLFQSAICACAVIIQAFALSGCSNNANEPYETSSDSLSVESTGEFSSEDSAASFEQSTVSSDASSPESDIGIIRRIWRNNYVLDQELLDAIEEDMIYVRVQLYKDDKAVRAEYEEKYPKLVENNDYWVRFQFNKGEQILRDFLPDYGIDYEEVEFLNDLSTYFEYELDKDTISLMLVDPRVRLVKYILRGPFVRDIW